MAAPVVSREELMVHCKVDDSEAGDQLMILQDAAIAYLTVAGATNRATPTYAMAVKAIVLHWFDHPDGGVGFGPGLQALITQLKLSK